MPALKTITVRVLDRTGWGTRQEYPKVAVLEISADCPRCGAQRGEPTPHRFYEDGEWLTCDRWNNPCGHVDLYENVLAEHKALACAR